MSLGFGSMCKKITKIAEFCPKKFHIFSLIYRKHAEFSKDEKL